MYRIAVALLFSGIVAAQSPENSKSDFISVKITAAIDESGALRASVSLQANGVGSTPFREAYGQGSPKPLQDLFGAFLYTRQAVPAPGLNNSADPDRPFQFTASVLQNEYLIPVQRVATLQLNPLHELPDPIASGDRVVIGQPGLRRTEIEFDVPRGFELKSDIHIQRDSTFARYRSQAVVESGKLIVLRELTIRNAAVSASERAAVEEFLYAVRIDEQRSFVLRRVARVDPSAWTASVPARWANTLGLRAYDQHEYEAARQLFEKSIAVNPASTAAWNNLGRALAALGRILEAQKAYEQQIAVHPADQFAYNNLALLFERQGNWGRAVENLEKQLQVDPGNHYAVNNLPRALLNAHLWDELETAAQKALIAAPTNVSQKLNVAIARICLGKSTNIREEIDRALGPNPIAPRLNDAAYYLAECDIKAPEIAELYTRRALDLFMNAAPPGPAQRFRG
jgi:tetratricopeptide (TPR) repeat protein